MPRKKLPAYGAALLKARRSGSHPVCVQVIYGNDWRSACVCSHPPLPGLHSMIAIKPEDYSAGVFDFAVVTGVSVAVFDQVGGALEYRGPDREHRTGSGWGPFYDLVRELAEFAGEIEIHSRAWEKPEKADWRALALRDTRARDDAGRNHGWPQWWSQEIEGKNEQRRLTWLAAGIERELERA